MTTTRMPAAWQRSTASATSGRGGSKRTTSARNVSERSASSRLSGASPGRKRRATASTRSPCRAYRSTAARTASRSCGVSGRSPAPARRVSHRLSTSSGAPLAFRRRRSPSSVAVDMSRSVGSKPYSRRRAGWGGSGPTARAASRMPISVASPCGTPPASTLTMLAARIVSAISRARSSGNSPVVVPYSRSTLAAGHPQPDRLHPVLRQRPGLVGADHRGRAERLDGREPLDQGAAARQLAHARRPARA